MIMARLWMLLLLLLLATSAAAETPPPALRELIAIGLENNLGLLTEKVNVGQQAQQVQIKQAEFDPEVQAKVSYEKKSTPYESSSGFSGNSKADTASGQVGVGKKLSTGTELSVSLNSEWMTDNDFSNDLDDRYRTALVLSLTQPLLRNLGRDVNLTNLKLSRNNQRQASLNYLLKAQQYILKLEDAFWQLAGSEQLIRLRKDSLALAQGLLEANRKRFAAGVVAVTEIQEAETATADRELSLSQAIQEHSLQLEELSRLLNYQLPENYQLASREAFPETIEPQSFPTDQALYDQALKKRLELKINGFDIENARLQKNYQANQLQPKLDLSLQAGLNGLAGEDRQGAPGSRYEGGWLDSAGSLAEGDGYQWGVGLNFSMPLGNREAQARYQISRMQLTRDRYARQDLELAVRNELRQQRINVRRYLEQLGIAERFAQLAEKTLQQEQRRLDEGLSDTFRMISFQENMISAKIGRVNAMIRYHLAVGRMAFVRGNIFDRYHIIMTEDNEELSLENL